jgi:hypothetical protein
MPCLENAGQSPELVVELYQRIITKIIMDNYIIIFIYFILLIFLALITYYFFNNIWRTLRTYRKNSALIELAPPQENNINDPSADNERYIGAVSIDVSSYNLRRRDDPMEYINKHKKDFLADVDAKYEEYNKAKTDYIKDTYQRNSDDVVDKDILFSRHDDYTYKTRDDEE